MNAAELRALLAALDAALARGQGAAIATVVGVKGSAYRREGTKMLVLDDASQVCMLSGGCLEAEVVEVALNVIESGMPALAHYDLSEDATWGLGIGCGGSVDVRVERVDPGDTVMQAWLCSLRQGEAAVLAVPLQGAGKLLVKPDGTGLGQLEKTGLRDFALAQARERLNLREPRAVTVQMPDGQAVFLDVNMPPPPLVIYGAGHDALPLSAQATALGYDVHVIDPREIYLTPVRFPGATLYSLAPEELNGFAMPERAQAIIMNHHLDRDRVCLHHALKSGAEYVGVLGPRTRTADLLNALEDEGVTFTPEELSRLRSPIGLRIGAEAPEEVALSILAELMAWRRGYDGGFLNGHAGRIHDAVTHHNPQPHRAQTS